MTEVIGVQHARRAISDVRGKRALHPALLHYAVVQRGADGLRLLHVPLGFSEEALVLFTHRHAAQRYASSSTLDGKWYARECSAGELASLLLGLYEGMDWVLLDPPPGCLEGGNASTDLVSRESFVDYLLE